VRNVLLLKLVNAKIYIVSKMGENLEYKKNGKTFPLQAWTGPWGSRRLRLQNF
jgi:hypothetical protein